MTTAKLNVGDWVQVRSREEILATLDAHGRLDELPFMPQMLQYCGRPLRVIARAHKTCDVIAGEGRRLSDTIHLDTRCDGQAFDGCQASCLIFWKQAWVKRVVPDECSETAPDALSSSETPSAAVPASACTEDDVWRSTRTLDQASGETIYFCQATRVPYFTSPLAWWDIRQYVEDYTSGNVSLASLASGFLYQSYNHCTQAWRHKVGRPGRWLYDALQLILGGIRFPNRPGMLPPGTPAPTADLNLQPGELVRVKPYEDILATVTGGGTNRGLLFDKEMAPYCGGTFHVKARVTTFVDERTGRLSTLKTPAVMLEGVWCQSRYSNKKMFCPRALHSWWREVWLERVTDDRSATAVAASQNLAGEPELV
jgi:hypothetical protein